MSTHIKVNKQYAQYISLNDDGSYYVAFNNNSIVYKKHKYYINSYIWYGTTIISLETMHTISTHALKTIYQLLLEGYLIMHYLQDI